MMKKAIALMMLALLLAGSNSWADPFRYQSELRHVGRYERHNPPRQDLSLDQAVEQVRRETGGRILSAETVHENGKAVHRIKVLTRDHRVRVILKPAGNSD